MAAITTPKANQSAIIKYYSLVIEAKKIPIIKSSRGGLHLRINYPGDVKTLMNSILKCDIAASDVSISGSYVTNVLTIQKDIPGAKKGDSIYFVNAVSSRGVLKTKQLTPNKLNLAGKKIAKNNFIKLAKQSVENVDVPENIKAFLDEIIDASKKQGGRLSDKHINAISDADINIIAKDFGEISGAIWFMTQFNDKLDSVEYPALESEALIDYYVYAGKKKIAVSAKANEGAPPSINAIAAILKTLTYTNKLKESARLAVISISEKSTVDGIVEASKDLQTPGYNWIKQNLFSNKDFTAADCEKVLKNYGSPEAVLKKLQPLYKLMGRSASEEIVKRIYLAKTQRWGILISPLGYHLVDQLNTNDTYLSVLNDAAQSIVVSQIYIKINKSTKNIAYTVKEFSASAFKFEYNANAGQPSLKKISFKMDKKATINK
jgi:copper chaperone CopZ